MRQPPTTTLCPARRPTRHRFASCALALGLLALATAGCDTAGEDTPTPATSPNAEALRTFYEQKIDWKACTEETLTAFECASLTVPLDYNNPAGQTIQLAINRKPAGDQAQRLGSLLTNPGGPGGSGVDGLAMFAEVLPGKVQARYDLVGFDPRGVERSAPIRCVTEFKDLPPEAMIILAPGKPSSTEALRRLYEGFRKDVGQKAFALLCQARSGPLLAHVSTAEAARDMDVLRTALGDAKLHYYGASYGTYLGAVYAELFPTQVGRMILDGATDPLHWPDAEDLRNQAAGYELALNSFIDDCARARPDCPLGTDPAQARGKFDELLPQLDRAPLPVQGTPVVNKDLFVGFATSMLISGSEKAWAVLRLVIQEALAGSGDTLVEILLGSAGGSEQDGPAVESNSSDALVAVRCADGPPAFANSQQVEAALPSFRQASPTFGETYAWSGLSCAYWPVKPTTTPHEIKAEGAPPILVVGNTRDPATPYSDAQDLSRQLSSGALLTYDGDGHTILGRISGNVCLNDAINNYLVDGNPPPEEASCR